MLRSVRWPGAGSYLLFLGWALFLVALLPNERLVPLLAVVFGFGLLGRGRGLAPLKRPRLWLLVCSIVVISGFILGRVDLTWGPLRLSREGLEMGAWMALRAVCLILAAIPGMVRL